MPGSAGASPSRKARLGRSLALPKSRAIRFFLLLHLLETSLLIHLIAIPVTNTSVNPARSTGPALVVGGLALHQLWLFWVAPLIGGAVGGWLYRTVGADSFPKPNIEGE